LSELTAAADTGWGRGLRALGRALLDEAVDTERSYRESIEEFEQSAMLPYRARMHLLFGEWLRSEGRRQESRTQLRIADELLSRNGYKGSPPGRRVSSACRVIRADGDTPASTMSSRRRSSTWRIWRRPDSATAKSPSECTCRTARWHHTCIAFIASSGSPRATNSISFSKGRVALGARWRSMDPHALVRCSATSVT
jgi:hypothetical protein